MLNSPVTELTTAATDAALAVVSAAFALVFALRRAGDRWRMGLWAWVFGLTALGSALGAAAHGLALGGTVRWALWQPLYLSLGLTIALFLVGALRDWRGEATARRLLPAALAVGAIFYAITAADGGGFGLFVAYEAAGMLAALIIYVRLAAGGRRGAGYVAAGIALTLAAAGVQASPLSLTVVWPFDHNALFHLAQLAALFVLAHGLWHGK